MGGIRFLSENGIPDLTLYICETFKEEINRVIADISVCSVHICLVPHHCSNGPHKLEELKVFLSEHSTPGYEGLFFGDIVSSKKGYLSTGVIHAGPDTCNGLIASPEFLYSLTRKGAYLVLPGWLLSWERFVRDMGLDPKEPTLFFSSNLKKVIVLDTGIVPIPEERINSFEIFSGLHVQIVPVGISHLSGIVHAEVNKWYAKHVRVSCDKKISTALESSALQMTVLTLISDIARISDEKDVISRISVTCQALFAPRSVTYLPFIHGRPGKVMSNAPETEKEMEKTLLLSAVEKEYVFSPEKSGFCVSIVYHKETLGILGIFEVSEKDRIREYLNLTLSFTRYLGVVIKNARSWNELSETKKELENLNNELRDKNEELISISQELQTSNQELIHSKQILVEKEQFISAVVSSARVGIAVLDTGFHVLFWNPEMERMFSLLYTDIKNKSFFDVFPSVVEYHRDVLMLQALEGKVIHAPDFQYPVGAEGKSFWISSIYSPVYDLHQNIIGIVLNILDITERKKTERDLEGAYSAIRKAQDKLSILSSITRHDILNRVMVITSYSEFLKDTVTDEKALKQLNNMSIAGKDIQHLIEFTREYQELGVKKPEWERIEDIINRRSVQSVLSGIDLTIGGLSAEIYVDPMLEKVLYNLVENSRRHGEKVTRISIVSEPSGEDLLIIYSDNGVGVSNDEKELIFKQGHGKNTGMGLFLIREILELTGISIRECGIPGEGVRFEMRVPKEGWRIV